MESTEGDLVEGEVGEAERLRSEITELRGRVQRLEDFTTKIAEAWSTLGVTSAGASREVGRDEQIRRIVNDRELSTWQRARKLVRELDLSVADAARHLGVRYQVVHNAINYQSRRRG